MIALYVLLGFLALLAYGGMCGLTFTVLEWLWPAETKDDRTSWSLASIVWWATLPVAAVASFAVWVASRLSNWRLARRLPKAQVFRG